MAQQQQKPSPTEEQIRARAYEIFIARGDAAGSQEEDWLRAESELRGTVVPAIEGDLPAAASSGAPARKTATPARQNQQPARRGH